ncbi:hypothetical protein [Marinigracilibium pacificum]|uniref:Uncharacterized protein n=1 Tax=Marinigracilibium pacificum TaxID=2729599 RepID=A0A848IWE1_9BACT|nr:hypothetical protein [Marinigracilibium pacificum]NMM47996.1 hypothetical protein [Marinigracilibium pacificum]
MEGLPKKHPFKTPENYFENLEEKIKRKTETASKEGTVINFYPNWIKVAASIMIIGVFTVVLYNFSKKNKTDLAQQASVEELINSVSDEDIIIYLTENSIDTDQLIEAASKAGVDQTDFQNKKIEETIIEDYIDIYL